MKASKSKTRKPFPVKANIYRRVALLSPAAKRMIATGIDDGPSDELMEIVPVASPHPMSDETCAMFVDWTSTVYALGIAVGLRLDPSLFKAGR